jgi:hypothetical protein
LPDDLIRAVAGHVAKRPIDAQDASLGIAKHHRRGALEGDGGDALLFVALTQRRHQLGGVVVLDQFENLVQR